MSSKHLTGKRKLSDTEFDTETESVCSNWQFQSPDEGGHITSEFGAESKKQEQGNILAHWRPEELCALLWPMWKDILLFKEMYLAQTMDSSSRYYMLVQRDNRAYTWRDHLVWEEITMGLKSAIVAHESTQIKRLSSDMLHPSIESIKERIRLYKKHWLKYGMHVVGYHDDVIADFRHHMRSLFTATEKLGPVVVPIKPRNSSSSTLSRSSRRSCVSQPETSINGEFRPRSAVGHDLMCMSTIVINQLNKFVVEGSLEERDVYNAMVHLGKSGILPLFIAGNEGNRLSLVKRLSRGKSLERPANTLENFDTQ